MKAPSRYIFLFDIEMSSPDLLSEVEVVVDDRCLDDVVVCHHLGLGPLTDTLVGRMSQQEKQTGHI